MTSCTVWKLVPALGWVNGDSPTCHRISSNISSPTVLAPGTGFVQDNFSIDSGEGGGGGP